MFRKMCDCEESVTPNETEQFVFVFTIFFLTLEARQKQNFASYCENALRLHCNLTGNPCVYRRALSLKTDVCLGAQVDGITSASLDLPAGISGCLPIMRSPARLSPQPCEPFVPLSFFPICTLSYNGQKWSTQITVLWSLK